MKKILVYIKFLLMCALLVGVAGILASAFDALAMHWLTPQAGLGLLLVSVISLVLGSCFAFLPEHHRPRIVSGGAHASLHE